MTPKADRSSASRSRSNRRSPGRRSPARHNDSARTEKARENEGDGKGTAKGVEARSASQATSVGQKRWHASGGAVRNRRKVGAPGTWTCRHCGRVVQDSLTTPVQDTSLRPFVERTGLGTLAASGPGLTLKKQPHRPMRRGSSTVERTQKHPDVQSRRSCHHAGVRRSGSPRAGVTRTRGTSAERGAGLGCARAVARTVVRAKHAHEEKPKRSRLTPVDDVDKSLRSQRNLTLLTKPLQL